MLAQDRHRTLRFKISQYLNTIINQRGRSIVMITLSAECVIIICNLNST